MVSERQRLARKRYKETNPHLFPKPEPTPPKDLTKKKKKLEKFKRKRAKNGETEGPKKGGLKKHPLRVPGMRPGEGCYICKSKDHIAKVCPEKVHWDKNKICLLCRQRGHALKNCPKKNDVTADKQLCYNCGETAHSLSNCPQPLQDGGTKFASCFICKEHGHLSKNCPQNSHGIYPKGGCCKLCGGVTHLAKNCPKKGNSSSINGSGVNQTVSGFEERPREQVTRFVSGDDLDDDFMTGDISGDRGANVPESHEKSKKKGPKVVTFAG
ncbi:Zinc finger, CCHC-type [Dillenia turbinata]|uniref:Zinc finger, CCHC-type n=1 Tax=Dillenia turbinata TaxID=194707 RepID=A0AAN8W0J0_9MAGN